MARFSVLFCLLLTSCVETVTCPEGMALLEGECVPYTPPDGGGGDVDGGQDAGADTGTDAGMCGGQCGDPTPFCVNNACAECRDHADCISPTAAKCEAGECVPCDDGEQCVGIAGLGICHEGECVECAPTQHESCGENRLCHGARRQCVDATLNQAECQPCVSDDQCMAGTACVAPGRGGEEGYFCLPLRGDGCTRPFVGEASGATIDGETVDFCRHRRTSCAGFNDFSNTTSGCATAADGTVVDSSAPGDGACGLPGVEDNTRCRLFSTGARCTYACSSHDDCRAGHSCTTGLDAYCSLSAD